MALTGLKVSGIFWKWLEMARNYWTMLDKGWKCMEMNGNGWNRAGCIKLQGIRCGPGQRHLNI